MALSQFDYDPLTGVEILWDYDEESGSAVFHKQQDVEPLLEWAKANRIAKKDDEMMKRDEYFCLFASIPATVEMELLKKGINIEKCDTKTLVQEIETNYPYLKHTERKLWRPT
jgi:hypothetical protein